MNEYSNLTPQQLRRAADIQERILELQNEIACGGRVRTGLKVAV